MKLTTWPHRIRHRSAAAAAALTVLLATTAGTTALAQGQLGFGTVSSSGTGPYVYNLSFSDGAGATSPIGSVWYAGSSLSGFSYQATFTPAQLASAPNSGVSDAYSGGLFSDSGNIFTVAAVPEPTTPALLAIGALTLAVVGRRKILAA